MTRPREAAAPVRLLDYPGVARYLSVGRSVVFKLVEAGEFPKVKIGSRVLFDVRDVDAYVERLRKSA